MFDGFYFWILALAIVILAIRASAWRSKAKKGDILSLLLHRGPLTGRALRDAGIGALVYNHLYDLEKDGLVERLSDGLSPPERGGLPRYHYRISEKLRGVARSQ